MQSESPFWLFAYGSLLWDVPFAYVESAPAFVRGWARRLWQGSTVYRGTPEAPGRVATLVRCPDREVCWGRAYRLANDAVAAASASLAVRERGHQEVEVALWGAGNRHIGLRTITFVATPEHPNYLGPAPLPDIARQVRGARGNAGTNLAYVSRLAGALRLLGVERDHVLEVEGLLTSEGVFA